LVDKVSISTKRFHHFRRPKQASDLILTRLGLAQQKLCQLFSPYNKVVAACFFIASSRCYWPSNSDTPDLLQLTSFAFTSTWTASHRSAAHSYSHHSPRHSKRFWGFDF